MQRNPNLQASFQSQNGVAIPDRRRASTISAKKAGLKAGMNANAGRGGTPIDGTVNVGTGYSAGIVNQFSANQYSTNQPFLNRSSSFPQSTESDSAIINSGVLALGQVPWMKFKVTAEPDMNVFRTDERLQAFIQSITQATVDSVTQEIVEEVTDMLQKLTLSINQSMESRMAAITENVISQITSMPNLAGRSTELKPLSAVETEDASSGFGGKNLGVNGGFGGNNVGVNGGTGFGGNNVGVNGSAGFGGNNVGVNGSAGFGGNNVGVNGGAGFGGNNVGVNGGAGFGGNNVGVDGGAGFGGNNVGVNGGAGFGGNSVSVNGGAGFGGNSVSVNGGADFGSGGEEPSENLNDSQEEAEYEEHPTGGN